MVNSSVTLATQWHDIKSVFLFIASAMVIVLCLLIAMPTSLHGDWWEPANSNCIFHCMLGGIPFWILAFVVLPRTGYYLASALSLFVASPPSACYCPSIAPPLGRSTLFALFISLLPRFPLGALLKSLLGRSASFTAAVFSRGPFLTLPASANTKRRRPSLVSPHAKVIEWLRRATLVASRESLLQRSFLCIHRLTSKQKKHHWRLPSLSRNGFPMVLPGQVYSIVKVLQPAVT